MPPITEVESLDESLGALCPTKELGSAETSPVKRVGDAEDEDLSAKVARIHVHNDVEIVAEAGPRVGKPSADADCPLVPGLLAAKDASLRLVQDLESRVWLKEQVESLAADESTFLELRDYLICDSTGELGSLLSVGSGNGATYFIFGHLFLTNLGEDVKPIHQGESGYLGTVRIELSAWGIWWVDPKPIVYVAVIDKELGLDATLELHKPHTDYAKDEERSQTGHLRRLLDIADIVLFEFVEKHPKATLQQEESRAREEPEEAVITLDEDGDETEEDQRVIGLHRLLMERRGVSLDELTRDPAALEFIAKQLVAEHMRVFYRTPLIQQLLRRDSDGNPLREGETAAVEPEQLLAKAPDHPLVVTPRVKRTLLRCMMDLLGDQAYGETLIIPKVVPEIKRGAAEKIRGSGEGVSVATPKCLTTQYSAVRIFYKDGSVLRLKIGDFVRTLDPDNLQFLKVLRLWQTESGTWKCHALTLRSADNSVLGICGLPSELLYTAACTTVNLKYIQEVVQADVEDEPSFGDWREEGALQIPPSPVDTPTSFRLRFRYDDTPEDLSFVYLTPEEKRDLRAATPNPILCRPCLRAADEKEDKVGVMVSASSVRLCGVEMSVGQTAYLAPDAVPLKYPRDRSSIQDRQRIQEAVAKFVDHPERMFPESRHYQKQLERGEFKKRLIEPYMVILKGADGTPQLLLLQPFYRSTDVDFGSEDANADEAGFLRVFDSTEVIPMGLVNWGKVFRGRCWVKGVADEEEGEKWVSRGQDRFYCNQRYEVSTRGELGRLVPLSQAELEALSPSAAAAPDLPSTADLEPDEQLCSLEMFCGGGGSSTGLHQAGIKTRVALDMDGEAVQTMRRNNPNADVRQIDVNEFLQSSIDGRPGFPRSGDFDVIFGGPPCQGFSAMNRSPNTANSKKKNTCVTTQCGAYDYFRPAYAALENVHGLLNQKEDAYSGVEGKKTSVCNVIVAVMLDIGFQVRVYQLNAGAYGVPQCRNRVFIVGAAPGHTLPAIPKPVYASQLPPVIVSGLNAQSLRSGIKALLQSSGSSQGSVAV